MKRIILTALIIPLIMGMTSIGSMAQNYDDDVYYTPSRAKKEREAARKAEAERMKKDRLEWERQRAQEGAYTEDEYAQEGYELSEDDIDAYNRRGQNDNAQVKRGVAYGNKSGKKAYKNKAKKRHSGQYSSRIARFHDPATILMNTQSGNVVVIVDNDRYGDYDYGYEEDYYGYDGNVSINVYPSYGWGYGSSSYFPWYDPWYGPWYYSAPWVRYYYYSYWPWGRSRWGYYDPWWGPGYGFDPGYAWGYGYGGGYGYGYRDGYWDGYWDGSYGYDPYSGRYYSRNYYANGRRGASSYASNNRVERGRVAASNGATQNRNGRSSVASEELIQRGRYDRGSYWTDPNKRITDNDRFVTNQRGRGSFNQGEGRTIITDRNSTNRNRQFERIDNDRRNSVGNQRERRELGRDQRGRGSYDGISRGGVFRTAPSTTSPTRRERASTPSYRSGRGSYKSVEPSQRRSSTMNTRPSSTSRDNTYSSPSSRSGRGSYSSPSSSSSSPSSSGSTSSSGGHRGR